MNENTKTNEIIDGMSINVNPFALAELVAHKKINWNKYKDETQALCETLNITKDELFSENSPILHPYSEVDKTGKVVKLSDEKAKERLSNFLADRTARRITKTPPVKSLSLKTIRETIPEVLLALRSNSEDVMPEKNISAKSVKKDSAPADKTTTYVWKDMGEYFKEAPEFNDPVQGALGDCYFIAALSSVAWTRPYAISNMAKPYSVGNETFPIHKFLFYKSGKEQYVTANEWIRTQVSNGSTYYCYARSKDQNEVWPAVIEKAYAKWRTGVTSDCPNMTPIEGGYAPNACIDLIGGKMTEYKNSKYTAAAILKFIKSNCVGKKTIDPMFASTSGTSLADSEYTKVNVIRRHAYSILGWDSRNGRDYVVLRNPWGSGVPNTNTLSGSYSYTDGGVSRSIPYNQDGVFALEINAFKKYYGYTTVVKSDKFKSKGV